MEKKKKRKKAHQLQSLVAIAIVVMQGYFYLTHNQDLRRGEVMDFGLVVYPLPVFDGAIDGSLLIRLAYPFAYGPLLLLMFAIVAIWMEEGLSLRICRWAGRISWVSVVILMIATAPGFPGMEQVPDWFRVWLWCMPVALVAYFVVEVYVRVIQNIQQP